MTTKDPEHATAAQAKADLPIGFDLSNFPFNTLSSKSAGDDHGIKATNTKRHENHKKNSEDLFAIFRTATEQISAVSESVGRHLTENGNSTRKSILEAMSIALRHVQHCDGK